MTLKTKQPFIFQNSFIFDYLLLLLLLFSKILQITFINEKYLLKNLDLIIIIYPFIGLQRSKMSLFLWIYIFLALSNTISRTVESKLEIIEDTGKSFKIAYEDVVIIDHNVKDPDNEFFPVMEIGIGSFDASEHLGNWKINDTVLKKMALDLYELGKNYKQ